MQFLKSVALAFAVIAVAIAPVLAHSLEEVDQDLRADPVIARIGG